MNWAADESAAQCEKPALGLRQLALSDCLELLDQPVRQKNRTCSGLLGNRTLHALHIEVHTLEHAIVRVLASGE
jgi:hypothetical protein